MFVVGTKAAVWSDSLGLVGMDRWAGCRDSATETRLVAVPCRGAGDPVRWGKPDQCMFAFPDALDLLRL